MTFFDRPEDRPHVDPMTNIMTDPMTKLMTDPVTDLMAVSITDCQGNFALLRCFFGAFLLLAP